MPLAHGIGGVRDLPVPESLFFTTAAIVLVVSFVLLGALWRQPLLDRHQEGRRLPRALQVVLLSPILRIALGLVSVALLGLTLATALLGSTIELLNWTPTFIYVIFWLGLPLLSVLFGDVWRVLSPWRAIADATVWAIERTGRVATPVLDSPWRYGRYPAALALFAFVALELAHPRPAYPRTLGVAVALYSYWALAGMAVFGRDAWTKGGEGFAVAFSLLSRIAPFAVRDGAIVVRWPFVGLAGAERVPGTLVFVAVLLGSTSFDGFRRTTTWQNLLGDVRRQRRRRAAVGGRPRDDVRERRRPGDLRRCRGPHVSRRGLERPPARPRAPLARARVRAPARPDRVRVPGRPLLLAVRHLRAVHLHAHIRPVRTWLGLFGTVDFAPNLAIVSPETVWYVQVAALVVGHVAGLAIAHDRAVSLFESRRDALRSQYPMLGLMVLYTVGGLWLLSQG